MKLKNMRLVPGFAAIIILVIVAGCESQRTAEPLFTTAPEQLNPPQPELLEVPTPPEPKSTPIVINIPMQESAVNAQNSIMRQGVAISPGSSVVISAPASIYEEQNMTQQTDADTLRFRTEGFFNVLEQYVERGLLSVGLNVKDRSKFEAKLRDIRDSKKAEPEDNKTYAIAIASLQKDLEENKITEEEFAAKAKQLRDQSLDPSGQARDREELTDISEVIRAAHDGEVMADYVLQVNQFSVKPYDGAPMQLALQPEVQAALDGNPGLRVGSEQGSTIPATLAQPWAQARFNAKMIDVKTGSIDWIGEHSIQSLAVLTDGITITIGVRSQTANGKQIVDAITEYNENLQEAYLKAAEAKSRLDGIYQESMQPVTYEGTDEDGVALQEQRKQAVATAEEDYTAQLEAYQAVVQNPPAEATAEWTFSYDVDQPIVTPDLFDTESETDQQKLMEHIKALAAKVTYDLLNTIKVSQAVTEVEPPQSAVE